jgi:hypothetical protein
VFEQNIMVVRAYDRGISLPYSGHKGERGTERHLEQGPVSSDLLPLTRSYLLKILKPPKISPLPGDKALTHKRFERILSVKTITFQPWLQKADIHLIMQNAFSPS